MASDIDHIVKGVNVGVDHMGIDEELEDSFMDKLEKDWNTIEGIRAEIEQAVTLLDGALVNDDCVNYYNQYLPTILSFYKTKVMPELTKIDIYEYVAKYLRSRNWPATSSRSRPAKSARASCWSCSSSSRK